MKITEELLAAYAEGKVTKEERIAVREYLVEHPEELKSVMIMMDENYELETEEEARSAIETQSLDGCATSVFGAAAFAPSKIARQSAIKKSNASVEQADANSFKTRLDDLCSELF